MDILAFFNEFWDKIRALFNEMLDFAKKYFLKDDSIFATKPSVDAE